MVATPKDSSKKKRTKDDDLLLFAMATSGTAANSLDGEGIFDDLLQASGFFPNPTHSGSVAAPGNPLNDIIAGAPSFLMNNMATLATTAVVSSLAASVIDRVKEPALTPDLAGPDKKSNPALHADLESDAAKKARTHLDVDSPTVKGHGRFGSIFSVAATTATLGVVGMSSATGENAPAASGPFNFFSEVGHWAQIVGNGLQKGLVGFVGAGEDLYDFADSLTGGRLWGDETTNATTEFLGKFADENLIRVPELRNDFERAIHKLSEVSTYLIPVGTVAKVAGFGARTIVALKTADIAWDVASLNSLGVSLTDKNIPELASDFAQNAAKRAEEIAQAALTKTPSQPPQTFDMA